MSAGRPQSSASKPQASDDRTQTLSVEPMTREEVQSLADVAAAWLTEGVKSPHVKSGAAKLSAALSQPEHQGEEECDDSGIRRLKEGEHEPAYPCPSCRRCKPPTPALSDEDLERLSEIAEWASFMAEVARSQGEDATAAVRDESAAFLRTLASQEHQGDGLGLATELAEARHEATQAEAELEELAAEFEQRAGDEADRGRFRHLATDRKGGSSGEE